MLLNLPVGFFFTSFFRRWRVRARAFWAAVRLTILILRALAIQIDKKGCSLL
jgi:hypothetical protein